MAFLGPLRQRCDNHCSPGNMGPLDIGPNGQARAMERRGLTSSAPKASPEWAQAPCSEGTGILSSSGRPSSLENLSNQRELPSASGHMMRPAECWDHMG